MGNKSSKKRLNNLVHRMSKEIKGLQLAHAFKKLKVAGFTLRVVELDADRIKFDKSEREGTRINVKVSDGRIIKSWIG